MTRRIEKGITFVGLLLLVLVLAIGWSLYDSAMRSKRPCSYGTEYSVCGRATELILAASSAKKALSEGMQQHHSWSPQWMSSITVSATGMMASATIGPAGQIIAYGTAPTSGSVVTLTPSVTTDDKLVWSCVGRPAKYMPASCR